MVKVIALDLDRTLLTSGKTISVRNTKILRMLHAQGIKIVIATGRPINAIWSFIKQLGLTNEDDLTVTFNGGLVVKNVSREPIFQTGLKKADLTELYVFAKAENIPLDVLDFEQVYPIKELGQSTYRQMLAAGLKFTPTKFSDLPDKLYSKVILSTSEEKIDQVVANLPAKLREKYHIVRSQPTILEFLAAGVDKAVGLQHLLDFYGDTADDLMAFGDAENDLGMLKMAGQAIVMGNANDDIKAVATHVTGDHNDDGVAQYLEKYFGQQGK